jgi:hypothetical protein
LRACELQRHTGLETDQDSFRDEVYYRTCARQPRQKCNRCRQHGCASGQRSEARRVAVRHAPERRTDEQRDCRSDADRCVPRAAEKPEHQPAKQTRVKSRLRWQTSKRCIAECRRQHVRRQRHARREIRAKPLRFVAPQPIRRWDHPAPLPGPCRHLVAHAGWVHFLV